MAGVCRDPDGVGWKAIGGVGRYRILYDKRCTDFALPYRLAPYCRLKTGDAERAGLCAALTGTARLSENLRIINFVIRSQQNCMKAVPFNGDTDMPTIEERTKAAAHFVIRHTPPEKLGRTKLNKVLWFADVASMRQNGETVTGETSYRRLPFGPVPNTIDGALDSLISAGAVVERKVQTYGGTRHEFLWTKTPDLSALSSRDCEYLLGAIEYVEPMTATEASEATHTVLWEEVETGAQMDIGAATVVYHDPTEADLEWARTEAAKIAAE